MHLTPSEKIRIILKRQNITAKELAEKTNQSRQNIANKLKRDNFTVQELEQIAIALNCKFQGSFILSDGEVI